MSIAYVCELVPLDDTLVLGLHGRIDSEKQLRQHSSVEQADYCHDKSELNRCGVAHLSSVTEQAFQLFGDCTLFRNLSPKEKELLFARVRIRDFVSGDSIFQIGCAGDSMMILLHGRIQISAVLPGGRPLLIAVVSPGEMFGEIAILDGGRRTANATAETACSVAILDRDDILEFLERNPGTWRNIVSVFCSHLRRADDRLAEIAHLHDEIRDKNRLLAEASEHKTRFLATASHDLRQPLHALGLFAAQLHDRMKSPEDALLINRIDTAVATMNGLFNALLDISKLDAGALTQTIADFPISALLTRIESTFATLADQKGLSFRLHADSDIWVRSDPILLERIVLNLVSNAVRYTTTGGIVVGYRRRDHSLRIEVWDTGPGIPEEQRRKIFSEFYRIGGNSEAGLGLGLAIVERLCKLLEHPLDLSSTPGKGSRFSVTVPITVARPKSEQPRSAAIAVDAYAGKLVVVIDRDKLARDSIGGLLLSWGCRVATATTSEAAIADLGPDVRPHLIIADSSLASSAGIEAVAHLRAAYGAVPAFLISGDTSPERHRQTLESGLQLLYKPVQAMTLRSVVSKFLKDRDATLVS